MSIYKAYDIRGVFNQDLTPKDAYLIGYYLSNFLKLEQLKLAHDVRLSQEILTKFFIQGCLDANCQIIYLGKSSTPCFYHSLFRGCSSGVMITASHNSKEYNGFKIMNKLENFDSRNGLYELEKLVIADKDHKSQYFSQIENSISNQDFNEFLDERDLDLLSPIKDYTTYLIDYYNKTLTENEKNILINYNFALDFSSGVSSLTVIPFLKQTKLKYTLLNQIPDGNFPIHSPDPLKAKEYLQTIELKNCLFTGAFDGDGDRLLFFDEDKEFILQDYIIMLYLDYFSKLGNKNFVCDLRISRYAQDLIKQKNGNLKLLRVGRSFYMDYLKEHSCVFGAELSGHSFFRDFHNLDNPDIALIYMLKIIALELLKNKNFEFSNLINNYKKYFKIPETNLKVKDADNVLEKLKKDYSKNLILDIDGYSFDFNNYWFNVRKSNTEPIIRINFEGFEKTTTKKEFENLINYINNI